MQPEEQVHIVRPLDSLVVVKPTKTHPIIRKVLRDAPLPRQLSLQIPARLNVEQTANLLGFESTDIPVLIKAGLLPTLGNPKPNAHKYFAAVIIEFLAQSVEWLGIATQTTYDYWAGKNAQRKAMTIEV